jgi:hypothetical protein
VHAHRIEVLDRADDHDVVIAIPHHFELVLFPSLDRFLDEDLSDGRETDALTGDLPQLVLVVDDARATAPEHIRGPDHDGVADLGGSFRRLVHRVSEPRPRQVEARCRHRLLEHLAVLGAPYGLGGGADQLDPVSVENPAGG